MGGVLGWQIVPLPTVGLRRRKEGSGPNKPVPQGPFGPQQGKQTCGSNQSPCCGIISQGWGRWVGTPSHQGGARPPHSSLLLWPGGEPD